MAKNTSKTSAATAPRDWRKAVKRTQQYIKLLSSATDGITAEKLRERVGAFTKHNQWSLFKLGDTYGFELFMGKTDDGLTTYQFRPANKQVAATMSMPRGARKTAPKGKGRARNVDRSTDDRASA